MNEQMGLAKREFKTSSTTRRWTPPIQLGGNWNTLRERIKKKFPFITNSDLQFMARGENELIARLQLMTGKSKSQIRDWIRKADGI